VPPRPVTRWIYFLYVDDIRTSQETCLYSSTASYREGFSFLYVNDVHTSKETLLCDSTASYGHTFFLFCMKIMFVTHRGQARGSLLPATGIPLCMAPKLSSR
jgi:hypothetical protein